MTSNHDRLEHDLATAEARLAALGETLRSEGFDCRDAQPPPVEPLPVPFLRELPADLAARERQRRERGRSAAVYVAAVATVAPLVITVVDLLL